MGGMRRFEDRLEQMISGVFARTFRSAVQPVEISAALAREVDNSAQILSRDRRLVPNQFHVEMAEGDLERLQELGPALNHELVSMLRDHATAQSYVFTGPVHIDLEPDPDLSTGRFRVRSETVSQVSTPRSAEPGRDPQKPSSPGHTSSAEVEVNGRRIPLTAPGLVIGRGSEADLRITDPGVSRKHAELRVDDAGYTPRVSIVDLGSTNGLSVNGRRTTSEDLADGAEIRIGNTTLRLRLHAGGDR
ncbi:hypothetical protein GCM10011519_21920 [Marmoricola endophyticus]|uniref:FHA domain-containing protein n=1 Tax=Marmoricola endophyticus TaxID=2040280 RepID=A0A917BKI3_9ACTN|nr:DUF3662 and FHA domain-containing protein [Marmoricola endophyticus]GGF47470.1 hypothetical protein GCM10011519_21920 [Marmoricola endophyticus]